jgi:uncharacterized protein YbgA (DUF1722 family)/uncharacterized protein YbbK (DUF523 family)
LEFPKPSVVISKCIEFESVRWNAQIINNDFVKSLIPHVDAIPVCPEVGIGLPVPRDTLRIVRIDDEDRLIQPKTGKDFTDVMREFTEGFLGSLPPIDGFIMMSNSPSSGLSHVKIYAGVENAPVIERGAGMFGRVVKERFGHLAVEDEGRLRNPTIREHFLRKLFLFADFRINTGNDTKDIVDFHTRHKLLLKSYNQKEMRNLGKIVANHEKKPYEEVYEEYRNGLQKVMIRAPSCGNNINVLQNSMGYFSDDLKKVEKDYFLEKLEQYREGKIPLIGPVDIMKSWIIRFDEEYLLKQSYFNPYPEDLLDVESIAQACDGRNYWK